MEELLGAGIGPGNRIAAGKSRGMAAASQVGAGAQPQVLLLKKLMGTCQAAGETAVDRYQFSYDVTQLPRAGSLSAKPNNPHASEVVQLGFQSWLNGYRPSRGLPSNDMHNNVFIREADSTCLTRSLSDNNFVGVHDGEAETMPNLDLQEERRIKRMLANRESARRSRKRKQDHVNMLQEQVSKMTVENADIMKQISRITLKCNELTSENETLRANVDAMRTKVYVLSQIAAGMTRCAAGTDTTMGGVQFSRVWSARAQLLPGTMTLKHTLEVQRV